ncbi:ketopantoate reductase family protein [Shewanella litorisediminis]|uniref:2-dehydropantoate 2-reductase n=1 Tax=Shewanella litorisediminis TaxID=1173586 RepID=A0ABX7G0K1_9GAMM|nr:2-dehydropantoate 2-reductase [Shewanella litorisediminis]MCL2918098.1 2-dehydropantoate 2-reductase [Shewanella litorisediminis]QRH00842.1 2-dehydropantoate 2-reductase [Shewanella litorisediminis]
MSQIGILGAGAVGQLIGHQLAASGTLPMLIDRQLHAISELLTLMDLNGNPSTLRFTKPEYNSPPLGKLDLLIVTVKAYQVVEAVTRVLPELSPHCHLLLLHNGLGPHEQVAAMLNGRGLTLGTTSQGALRLSKYDLKQTGSGLTQFGHCMGPAMAPELKASLLSAIPGSEWVEAILPALWQKLAVNACINPLTAIHGVCNGELADDAYQATIAAVLRELVEVARTQGMALQEESLSARVYEVIRLTASNRSSMRQDVDHRRKTEIDAINGYLVSLGNRHGVATPTNKALVDAIHALERRF